MFTGLIQEVGEVQAARKSGGVLELVLRAPRSARRVKLGDSLAVNGCCLTVVKVKGPALSFQAVPETLQRTVLGSLKPGDRVDLELPLTPSSPLGGHFVQGHVDGVGRILEVKREGKGARVRIGIPGALAPYVVEKGSVALDGVSLTVARAGKGSLEVALIPHTLAHTALGWKRKGDRVNVETDLLAKYVERLIEPRRRGDRGGRHKSRKAVKKK